MEKTRFGELPKPGEQVWDPTMFHAFYHDKANINETVACVCVGLCVCVCVYVRVN